MASLTMPRKRSEANEVSRAIARIQSGVLALVCAVIGGMGIFTMTVWLLIKGGPNVGVHLQLLRHYFIGYSVTWTGSVVGFVYGALLGGVVGWIIGNIYNRVVRLRQRWMVPYAHRD
jgi:membrane protein YqaA with SNARE-associated domain